VQAKRDGVKDIMARPRKQTVDYFPHDTDASINSRTLKILENRFGNDGYTFWYKLLEFLGRKDGHYFDFSDEDGLEYLASETKIKDIETLKEMLEILVKRGSIDKELYERKIIWCQSFVDGVADAYRNRKAPLPQKPKLNKVINPITTPDNAISDSENPQTKLNETKLNETITTTKSLSSLIKIYEQEKFGELTPFIESELQAALKEFGAEKIKEAFKIAVRANKRKWSYVAGILENWRAKNADKKFGKWGARVSLRGAVYRAKCKEAGVSFTEKGEKQNEILARASSMSDEELLAEAERLKL
jgi:DnaD/phage-associated family protein